MIRAGGLAIALLLAAGPALARGKTNNAEAEAKKHYASGMKHYDVGEWDAAIADFKEAFALTDRAPLLFNLGQAARKKHDWEAARNFYQAYLRRVANPPNATDVKRFIAEAEDEMRKAAAQAAAVSVIAPPPKVETPPPVENPPPPVVNPPPPEKPPVEVDRHPGRSLKRIGLITVAAGVLLLGGALACGLIANDDAGQLATLAQQRGAWSDHYQSLYSSGQSAMLGFDVLVAAGAVVVVAGGVLAILGVRRDSLAQRVGLAPVPGGAALTLGGSF
jgi:tetratricopeptide (TPR) repeat protein